MRRSRRAPHRSVPICWSRCTIPAIARSRAEAHYPFRVVNFTDVLAEALGRGRRTDYYKLYKTGGEMQEAVEAAREYLQSNGVKVSEDTIAALSDEMFNETGLSGGREGFRNALATLAT